MALFDEAGTNRIAEAVAAVEAKTSGEIVVTTVPRSAQYAGTRLGFAGFVAVFAAILASAFAPRHGSDLVLLVELLVALGAFALASVPAVLRRLVGAAGLDETVGHRALRAFAEQGIHDTRERTGVLIFLSELERRAVILGDTGIDARVGREGWERLVATLTASLHDDHGVEGVCKVIAELGDVLARDLPVRDDHGDELPNRPVRAK